MACPLCVKTFVLSEQIFFLIICVTCVQGMIKTVQVVTQRGGRDRLLAGMAQVARGKEGYRINTIINIAIAQI